jgi:hypothetical protein
MYWHETHIVEVYTLIVLLHFLSCLSGSNSISNVVPVAESVTIYHISYFSNPSNISNSSYALQLASRRGKFNLLAT